jgi:hypothetical protein
MSRVFELLNRQPRMRIVLLGLLPVAFLWFLDYLTGSEISFSIIYSLPVALIAWYAGQQAGFLFSFAAAASWLMAELLAGASYSHPAVPLQTGHGPPPSKLSILSSERPYRYTRFGEEL